MVLSIFCASASRSYFYTFAYPKSLPPVGFSFSSRSSSLITAVWIAFSLISCRLAITV